VHPLLAVALVSEEVAAQHDLLSTVLQADMAVVSVEQTEVGVRQNAMIQRGRRPVDDLPAVDVGDRVLRSDFRWLVDNITDGREFLLYGLGGLPVPVVALVVWLLRASPGQPSAAGSNGFGGPPRTRSEPRPMTQVWRHQCVADSIHQKIRDVGASQPARSPNPAGRLIRMDRSSSSSGSSRRPAAADDRKGVSGIGG